MLGSLLKTSLKILTIGSNISQLEKFDPMSSKRHDEVSTLLEEISRKLMGNYRTF
jgi:hypothetical protein